MPLVVLGCGLKENYKTRGLGAGFGMVDQFDNLLIKRIDVRALNSISF